MPQIKISIPEKFYKQLKKDAEENFRTLGAEVAFITEHYFNHSSLPTTGYAVSLTPTTQPTQQPETPPAPSLTLTEPDNEYYKKIKRRLSHHVRREFSTVAGPT